MLGIQTLRQLNLWWWPWKPKRKPVMEDLGGYYEMKINRLTLSFFPNGEMSTLTLVGDRRKGLLGSEFVMEERHVYKREDVLEAFILFHLTDIGVVFESMRVIGKVLNWERYGYLGW
jgi:hypothetical protein